MVPTRPFPLHNTVAVFLYAIPVRTKRERAPKYKKKSVQITQRNEIVMTALSPNQL